MNAQFERRGVLAGIGALVLLPFAASARPASPVGPFVLKRTLRRSLSDGKQVCVTRRWSIAFEATGDDGLSVTGAQIDAHVDAPPALRAMAQIEAARDEGDLFPVRLDREGRVVSGDGAVVLAPLPETVVDAALAYAKARSDASAAQTMSRQFLAELSQHSATWLSGLPADLFFPAPRDHSISREISLPDGTTGTFEVHESVAADGSSGLLKRFLREAQTTTRDLTRKGSETWTLNRAVS